MCGLQGRRGQSLVELALLLPFLLWVVAGVVDFGRIYYYDNVAINAARSGARVAADHGKTDAEAQAAAVADAGSRLPGMTVAVTPTPRPATGNNVTVTITYQFRAITPFIGTLIGDPRTIERSATMMVIY